MEKENLFTKDMLDFMMDIRFNNNKAFMTTMRDKYIRVMRDPYYRLIEQLAPTMKAIDPDMEVRPVKCLSRIFRDTRYSHDKSPYRDHHWIAFRKQGVPRDQSVMFWFEIRLEYVSWGMGFWGENKEALESLRRKMAAKPDELLSLLPILNNNHFILEGRRYQRKSVPESLPASLRDWYLSREIYLTRQGVDPNWIFEEDLHQRLIADYLLLEPFYKLFTGLDAGNQT